MKKNSLLMIAAAILMTACGTMAQQSVTSTTSRFEDGIYSSGPSFRSKVERAESKAETDALVERTKASSIYLFGDKKDTVMIPRDMSASIWYDKDKGSTVVNVGYNPYDWMNNIDPWSYYTPYSIGSSWYWSRHYDPWYSSPYYWNSWAYTPYRYYGWYDPFYVGGWYDPWYYGYGGWYGGWYNPYYGYMYPHYAGWYGGWDPYWGYHHHHHIHVGPIKDDNWHGSRHSTGSDRVFTSRVSTRGGVATASRTGRTASVASTSRAQSTGSTTATRVTSRTSASRVSASTPSRVSASKVNATSKPTTTTAKPTSGSQQNYRRPTYTVSGQTGTAAGRTPATSPSYRSSDSQSYRSSGSSYRSSSSSSSRSSYTPSSTSRSSYSSGSSYSGGSSRSGGSYSGGGSRSGGSSGGRR